MDPSTAPTYLKQRPDLLSAAQRFVAALSRAGRPTGNAAMLGDENGIVLGR